MNKTTIADIGRRVRVVKGDYKGREGVIIEQGNDQYMVLLNVGYYDWPKQRFVPEDLVGLEKVITEVEVVLNANFSHTTI